LDQEESGALPVGESLIVDHTLPGRRGLFLKS